MPKVPHLELFSLGQEFALVIPRPALNQAGTTLYNGATENDLVGFASILSHELGKFRDFWDQPSSRTWTLMLLTGGGLAIYLLCRKKCEEENIFVTTINSELRRLPPSHGRYSQWGARNWFGWIFDIMAAPTPPTVLGGQYFGPLIGPTSNDIRHLSGTGFGRKLDARLILAPCPNCLKGSCKIKKHRNVARHLLAVGDSNTSSSSTSPMRAHAFAFLPSTSTPELADDEASDGEPDGIMQRIPNINKYEKTIRQGLGDRKQGDGEHVLRKASLSGGRKSGGDRSAGKFKHRIPPEGREKNISPSKRSLATSSLRKAAANLSCGDVTCKDMFCRSQMNKTVCANDRETSIDSISQRVPPPDPKYSRGMIGLIRGAREVRRLIREASFDSTASEFSLGVSISEELCDADKSNGFPRLKFSSICSSEMDLAQDIVEETWSESEESQLDFRLLQQKCASSQKHKRLWRLSAPLQVSDFDSPEHHPQKNVLNDPVYQSPHHEWQDQKLPKYKLALHGGTGSKTHSSSVSEISEGIDGLEWDTEDFAPQFDDMSSELDFCVDSWLEDNLELDLEAELSRINSERSSRRNSFSSDLDSTYLYRSVRLPPSGRSSVTRGICGGESSSGETPQKCIDSEMLIRSFGVASTTPPKDPMRPSNIGFMKRSTGSSGSLRSPVCSSFRSPSFSKWKESSPIYDYSSRRHYTSLHDPTTVTMSNTGCLLATTPLSPVHEAKEPRQSVQCVIHTQAADISSNAKCTIQNGSEMSPTKRQIFRDNSSCALPDLEEIVH